MILEKARELGIALSESDEFINMTRTREAMEADTQLMDELNEYNAMQESIARLLTMDGDNQAEIQQMSRDIERLHDELIANETFRAMLEAQAEFQQLMKRVNALYEWQGKWHRHLVAALPRFTCRHPETLI